MRHENKLNKNEYRVCNPISFLIIFSKYRFMLPAFEYISPACKCVWGFDQLHLDVHYLQEIKTGCRYLEKLCHVHRCRYLFRAYIHPFELNNWILETHIRANSTGSPLVQVVACGFFCVKSLPKTLVSVDVNVNLMNRVIDMLVKLYFAMLKCMMQLASPLRLQYANAQKTIVSRGIYLMMQSKYNQQIQSINIWRYAVGVTKAQCFTVTFFFCSWFVFSKNWKQIVARLFSSGLS